MKEVSSPHITLGHLLLGLLAKNILSKEILFIVKILSLRLKHLVQFCITLWIG